jgi:hypothetical protein
MTDVTAIADSLTECERDLLLGFASGWGSWMWEAGEVLCSKGLGTRGPGTIQFNTPLANEVREYLKSSREARAAEKAAGNNHGN